MLLAFPKKFRRAAGQAQDRMCALRLIEGSQALLRDLVRLCRASHGDLGL